MKDIAPGKAKEVIEIGGKVAIAGLGWCYATGLLVVNVYYNRFGVYSLGLVRLNYILSGLWVFVPIAIVSATIAALVVLFSYLRELFSSFRESSQSSSDPFKKFRRMLVAMAFLAVVIDSAIIPILELRIDVPTGYWVRLIVTSTMVATVMGAILYQIYRDSFTQRPLTVLGLIVVLFLFYIVHTIVFARVYGAIPAHVGGGGTKDVQLLLGADESDRKFFELSGLRFYENSNWTKTARLLFATDEEYVFLVQPYEWNEASTLSIKKELIKSVLYQGLRGGGAGGSFGSDDDSKPLPSPTVETHGSPSATPSPPQK